MNSIKVCEYSRSRSFHDDLILHDQASGERSQDQWSSGVGFLAQRLKYNTSEFSLLNVDMCVLVYIIHIVPIYTSHLQKKKKKK